MSMGKFLRSIGQDKMRVSLAGTGRKKSGWLSVAQHSTGYLQLGIKVFSGCQGQHNYSALTYKIHRIQKPRINFLGSGKTEACVHNRIMNEINLNYKLMVSLDSDPQQMIT